MPTLDWIGKHAVVNHHREVPTRLLHCDGDLSFGDRDAGNLLVEGDNLEALKALLPFYAGKIKCIFIDPPYNTGNEGWIYNDNVNSPEIRAWLGKVTGREADDLSRHDKWLCMMYPRLRVLRDFLSEDGTIWASIDDNECHYLKAIMDEIFGRANFVCSIAWQSKDTPSNNATGVSQTHNTILVFAKSSTWKPNHIVRNNDQISTYKNPDNDPRGPWLGTTLTRAEHRDRDFYPIENPAGRQISPPPGSSWRRPPGEMDRLKAEGRMYWGRSGDADFPKEKKFLSEVKEGIVPQTWWPYEFAGSTRNASSELKGIFDGEKNFDTPKPEKLIFQILQIATRPGDMVLDAFAGSGTTGAVAHKAGRSWIMVELGAHCETHVVPRLKRVVLGEDKGGVSTVANWSAGGGFRYCRLGKTLFDEWGAINDGVTFSDLAAFAYFSDTGNPIPVRANGDNSLIGTFDGRAIYLLFSPEHVGIPSARAGNVLTIDCLGALPLPAPGWTGPCVVYGEGCTVPPERLASAEVTFKQVPYQLAGA
jgi:DNA modification methylase